MFADRIRVRKVPLATGLWFGTDKEAISPSLTIIIWLPFCRATIHPMCWKALITSFAFREGTEDIIPLPQLVLFQWSMADHVQL